MSDQLNSSLTLGRLTLPNRLAMTAMGVNLGAPDGGVTNDLIAYYEARARGGVGLIITEVTRIEGGAGISDPCQLACYRPSDVTELQRLADAVHKWETRLFIQLQHPGRAASSWVTGQQPIAPSAVASPLGGEMPRELSLQECREMVDRFVKSARLAQMAGADGVELHAAHGYLINQFLSPAMNFRQDEYGGSFDNRMRFVTQILEGIRESCGECFPISVRINAEELFPGGIDIPEAVKISKALEQAGAALINVSCYTEGCIEPGTYAQGWKKHMAQAIKEAVSIPVLSVCNIKEPSVARQLLDEGVCDIIGLGRALLADPEWPNKAFSGREDEIRTCIGCLCCFGEIVNLRRVRCAVNPLTGRELEYAHPLLNGKGQTVAVVGGGPAGIQAALTLKERGFSPVLIDEDTKTGGALNIADKGHGKDKITKLTQSLQVQLEKAGIELRLGEKASLESLKKLNPAAVFIACGAEPRLPKVPGVTRENVTTADKVLLGQVRLQGRVAVIGSGMTGLETAEMLAMEGCKVTVAEMQDTIGCDVYPSVVSDIMGRLLPRGAQILTAHKLTRIEDGEVELLRLKDNTSIRLPVDWVVLAVGVIPRHDLAAECKENFQIVRVIGDAQKPARILEAMQDAHGKAFVL